MYPFKDICDECGRVFEGMSSHPADERLGKGNCGNTGCEDAREYKNFSKRQLGLPGIRVEITKKHIVPHEFKRSDLDAVMNEITVVQGAPIDPNSMLSMARTVAEFYKLDGVVEDIDKFYTWAEGNPMTLKTGVIFWMTVFRRLRK